MSRLPPSFLDFGRLPPEDTYRLDVHFEEVSGSLTIKHEYWVEPENPEPEAGLTEEEEASYCLDCIGDVVVRLQKETGTVFRVVGGWTSDMDMQIFCEACGVHLHIAPTDLMCESEVLHFLDRGFSTLCAYDCYAMHRVILARGWGPSRYFFEKFPHLRERALQYYKNLHELARRISGWVDVEEDLMDDLLMSHTPG